VGFQELYKAYGEKVQFIVVYIREGRAMEAAGHFGMSEGIWFTPYELAQRKFLAEMSMQKYALTMPFVLDDIMGTAEKAYGGWPVRAAIVDIDGRIAYHSPPWTANSGIRNQGEGAAVFSPPAVEEALKLLLANDGKFVPPAKEPVYVYAFKNKELRQYHRKLDCPKLARHFKVIKLTIEETVKWEYEACEGCATPE